MRVLDLPKVEILTSLYQIKTKKVLALSLEDYVCRVFQVLAEVQTQVAQMSQ